MNRENNKEYVLWLAFKKIICSPFTNMLRAAEEIKEMFNKEVFQLQMFSQPH